ncbi:hypothetical protein [Algoriphagus vanfongensis]|uniref:hypothetical protein n=1 Tax=Algoriphagus vanfongensis TaxID=426371 RepID=UPI0012F8F46A|nr:hypothetical protein [Algoriphagus vanfongensis]
MKKSMLIAAMFVSGVALATPQLQTIPAPTAVEIQEGKVKIEPDALPDPVKTTIANDEAVKSLTIAEAWQMTLPDGTFQFKVVFDDGTEEKLAKKYDQDGNEIKE